MAGAIAGTAPLDVDKHDYDKPSILTVTVNNSCNFNCNHCYLQYTGEKSYLNHSIAKKIADSSFKHIALVGAEPLFNQEHVDKTSEFIYFLKEHDKTVSLITNGSNLNLLDKKTAEKLAFIDVSFDGGQNTYSINRMGDYNNIIKNVRSLENNVQINALHTLHSKNINNINDMLSINKDALFKTMLFSPYLKTNNDGTNSVGAIHIQQLIELLNNSNFKQEHNAVLMIDSHYLSQEKLKANDCKNLLEKNNLLEKTAFFPESSLDMGIMRVSYDGLVMTPEDSLHTKTYSKALSINSQTNLDEIFSSFIDTFKR